MTPVLDAYDTGMQYVVWCEPEQRWHYHAREEGDRVAHCVDPRSSYKSSGYVLRLAGRFEDLPQEVRKARARAMAAARRRDRRRHT